MPMPDEIFLLEEKYVCVGPYVKNLGCRCLLAWTNYVKIMNGIGMEQNNKIHAAIIWAKKRLGADYRGGHTGFTTYSGDKVTRGVVSRIWNLAWAKLGYTEGNPETKNLPKKKGWCER